MTEIRGLLIEKSQTGQTKPREKYPGVWLPDENHRVVFLLLVVKGKEDHLGCLQKPRRSVKECTS
jgi:hypothetical protein